MGKRFCSEIELATLPAHDAGFQKAALTGAALHLDQNRLSWSGCAAILATYNVCASAVLMPFVFGRLGYAVAPVVVGMYIALCCWLQHQVILMTHHLPNVQNLPELGGALAGTAGRKAFHFLQVANQQGFMPCAMLLVITSLKQVVLPASEDGFVHPIFAPGLLSCNVVWILFGAVAFLIIVNLQRRFHHASGLCKVTCVINVLQVACVAARVTSNWADFRGKPHSAWPSPHGEPEPWFPLPVTNEVYERSYWLDLLIAMSAIGYSYAPIFIATEAMNELKVASEAPKALWWSSAAVYVVFVVSGLFPVLAWGWKRQYEAVDPDFDVNDWSARACFRWFLLSLPTLVVSVLMLCFVPRLHSLVGLLSAFVIPCAQIVGPAILTILAARRGVLGRQLGFWSYVALLMSFVTGIAMAAFAGIATVYGMLTEDRFKGSFFCEAVAG